MFVATRYAVYLDIILVSFLSSAI